MELTADYAVKRATDAAEQLASEIVRLNGHYALDDNVTLSASKEQIVERLAPVILSIIMDRFTILPAPSMP